MERPVSYHNGVPWSPSKPGKAYRRFKKTIVIDSRDRVFSSIQNQGGTPKVVTNQYGDLMPMPHDYYIQFPNAYKNVYAVRLLTAEIPTSFYVFNSTDPNGNPLSLNPGASNYYKNCVGANPNGILWANISTGGNLSGDGPFQVTLPAGNYTLVDSGLQTDSTLQTNLAESLSSTFGGVGAPYTVSVDGPTQKLTITASGADIQLLNAYDSNNYVLPGNTYWGLGYFLGFQKTNVGPSNSLTGNYPVQLNPYNYILMELDFINKMDETPLENQKSGSIDSVFAKIPLNANSFSYVFDSVNSTYEARSVLTPPLNKLQGLHVKFRYHDGTPVNFNNVEHSFTLELELLDTNFDEWSSLETSLADPSALEGRRFNA